MSKQGKILKEIQLTLFDGHSVELPFYCFVVEQVAFSVRKLTCGGTYPAEDLLNDLLQCVSPEQHSEAKRCLADIVTKRVFPLGFTETRHHYTFIPTGDAAQKDSAIRSYLASN